MSNLRFQIDDVEVRRTLAALPMRLSENIRKKSIRAAARPFVKSLASEWRTASYRGKAIVRPAIARSTRLRGPKRRGTGASAPLQFAIGIDYSAKSGKGRQRVWHLLENGFRHVASGKTIPGSGRSFAWAGANSVRLAKEIQRLILVNAKEALR